MASWLHRFRDESRLMREIIQPYKKWVALGISTLLVVDLIELLPTFLIKHVVDLAEAAVKSGDSFDESGFRRSVLMAVAAYSVAVAVQVVGRYLWRMWLVRSSMLAGRDLRDRFARQLFALSPSFFDRNRVGDLMSMATSDAEAVRMALGAGVLTAVDAAIYVVTIPLAMLWMSPALALVSFVLLPIIPIYVVRNERKIHQRFKEMQESLSSLSGQAQEALAGVRVTKAFAREAEQVARFDEKASELRRRALRLVRVQSSFGPTLDFIVSLSLAFLLLVGGKWVIGASVSLGTFVAFQRFIQKLVWPMTAIGLAITHYQRASASSARMNEVLGARTDVPEKPLAEQRLPEGREPAATPAGPWRTAGRIEARSLSFAYPGSDGRRALDDVSFTIEPGERVALVGRIGSGKSTLVSLIPRLYLAPENTLFVDGVPVERWPLGELRRQIGFVSQEVFLFSEGVASNIAFGLTEWRWKELGLYQGDAEEEQLLPQIRPMTELAAVHAEISGLAEGYGTRLGERGVNLSGGQRQRITLARAIARQPAILILDDALSAVDVQTEERILGGLRSRPGKNTEIIAAHRISTVRDADRILVFEGGRIVQQGTHARLVSEKEGIYRRFYDQQRVEEELANYIAEFDRARGRDAAALDAGSVGGGVP